MDILLKLLLLSFLEIITYEATGTRLKAIDFDVYFIVFFTVICLWYYYGPTGIRRYLVLGTVKGD